MIGRHNERDRAVSITVTHVLTIGITTILIAGLLTSAGTMLETETQRSTEASLETIGERMADEIGNVDQIATPSGGNVTITADHPRTVANSRYTVEFGEDCEAPLLDGSTDCLELTAANTNVVVHVPIKTDAAIDTSSSARGGTIEIVYDGTTDTILIRSWSQ
jgi:FlaG/FlaF family flagellin (archaellin)